MPALTFDPAPARKKYPPLPGLMYFGNPSTPSSRAARQEGIGIGAIDTPAQGNKIPANTWWIGDNGCFGKGYPGDLAWLRWLDRHPADRDLCLFVTLPDVVGDAWATEARSRPFIKAVREMAYSPALVAQNGAELSTWDCWGSGPSDDPNDSIDGLFIGGDTAWKLGAEAANLAAVASSVGKWVHMGRVNSRRRVNFAREIGCTSVDGTYLTYGPDTNLPSLRSWLANDGGGDQMTLFDAADALAGAA
jgi:hypothetical protein